MIQYFLTGLAGLALGLVIMRLIQSRPAPQEVDPASRSELDVEADGPAETTASNPKTWSMSQKLLAGAGGLVLVAVALILLRTPEESGPAMSLPSTASGTADQAIGDVDTMISRLAKRLESNPTDGEGFRMLGWSYVMTGNPEKAIAPYKRAMALLPANALVHSGYGEALVGIAKNTVTDEARGHFDKALAIDPKEPRALYFAALWQAQHGKEKEALDKWVALANSAPAEASWQPDLRARIAETAKKLGIDVSARLKAAAQPATAMGTGPMPAATEPPPLDPASMQAASALPPAQRQEMIDGMVEGLAKRLKDNPRDADGWARLLRSRMVLKQTDKAAAELNTARAALKADPQALARLNAAVSTMGIPGA